MKERFEGPEHRDLLLHTLAQQRSVGMNPDLANAIADNLVIFDAPKGTEIITQEDSGTDVFFALTGCFDIVINSRPIKRLHAPSCFGEMAALAPQRRSATVLAVTDAVIGRIAGPKLVELGRVFPDLFLNLARDLAQRLLERNALIAEARTKIKVFIISSLEAIEVAKVVEKALEHESVEVRLWTSGVFKVANYTLEDLENELNSSDFAVAIAHPDDKVQYREEEWPAPRDNVVFELGYFMGRLGRQRAILMEPKGQRVKLPSDLAGMTTIRYKLPEGGDIAGAMEEATGALLEHVLNLGVFKG